MIKDYQEHFIVNTTINNNGCWIWNKQKDKSGYGKLQYKGKLSYAHRISFLLFNKKDIGDMCVCHSCDNPSCVNPNHLFLGTHSDNMKDMCKKGRKRGGYFKLTKEDVDFIKKQPKTFGSGSYLARLFGVSEATISDIRKGKTWK